MFMLRNQMISLLGISALGSMQLGGAAWVALLYARGFSMIEIGAAEGVFHIASLLFEIPSGVISDVFGRKRAMALSQISSIISSLLMVLSTSFAGVCLALVFSAFSYNFASGAREALAYDSLKREGQERHYLRYASADMMIYRVFGAAATLLTGFTLWLGYRRANLLDALLAMLALLFVLRLREVTLARGDVQAGAMSRIKTCFSQTFSFILHERRARRVMLLNAVPGAMAILLLFFLQAQLPLAGLERVWLGPALFVMGLGGALGARMAVRLAHMRYRGVCLLCWAGVIAGVLLALSQRPALMCVGGFIAGAFDDLLQVKTDARLNDMFPSQQRATLVSVSSLCFSLVMVALSPMAGWLFEML